MSRGFLLHFRSTFPFSDHAVSEGNTRLSIIPYIRLFPYILDRLNPLYKPPSRLDNHTHHSPTFTRNHSYNTPCSSLLPCRNRTKAFDSFRYSSLIPVIPYSPEKKLLLAGSCALAGTTDQPPPCR
ncbi:hypothetical protein Hdeb2414_s0006g00206591 [Helianthus debilis subsp. tardiflorus]